MANIYDTPYFEDYQGLRSLITQPRVEAGINYLKSNQGMVNTLTGLPIGPSSGRAYIRNLSGSEEPITEDFFNADQLSEIKNRTASSMADYSMQDFDSRNKRNRVVPYNLEKPISMSGIFSNPVTDIDATLGTYTYKQNPDDTVSAIDTHDFDSIAGGGKEFYDQKKRWVGDPDYRGTRGLPFLEPWSIPADPGFFIGKETDEFGDEVVAPYGPANIYDPYPTRFVPGDDAYTLTQEEDIYEPKEDVTKKVFDAFHNEEITGSKLARIIGGVYGHSGTDLRPDEESMHAETGDYLMRNNPNWARSGIPMNINLGRISHRDKLRANPNFARYIADTRTIPSQIRKQAQKIAPRRITPTYSPHGAITESTGGGANLSPGGGYGQSPTGRDIQGTPFSRGGILGAF